MNLDESPTLAPPSGRVGAWLSAIENSHREDGMAKYDDRCARIRKRYRYESSALVDSRRYQMLWSNIETMKSAVYAKPPHATVSRRFRDADPVGRSACEILERAINFTFDASDFDSVFKQVRDDFLLYARGCARIYYEPEYETKDDLNEDIEDARDISKGSDLATGASIYNLPAPIGLNQDTGGPRLGIAGDIGRSGADVRKRDNSANTSGSGPRNSYQSKSGEEQSALKFENVRIRFVQRADFRHQPARTWAEVQWVAFRAFMTRAEVKERFGEEIGKGIGLDVASSADRDDSEMSHSRDQAKATIWEIWDKAENRVLWIAKSWPEVLEEGEPYLILDGFYPCPPPAFGTLTRDSLVPVPDYVFYQDQCEEIDQLTARIGALSDALKLVGFYPGGPQGEGSPEIEKAFAPGFENKMIAVQSWDTFRQGGGGSAAPVLFLPIDQVIKILEGCVTLRKQLVEDIYQIIGISDIMRGATDPQETEGAQQLKAQYGGTRVRDRQQEIARFCRDIARLSGQVIAAYCSPETIMKMTNTKLPTQQDVAMARLNVTALARPGMPPPTLPNPGPTQEDVFGLLKDALSRRFKIDIENDSTIAGDESQERRDRTEFIQSLTQFMEAWGPMVIQKPELSQLASQLLLFGVRGFRVGRELEETIEETADKLQAGQASQTPQPDQAAMAKVQAEQLKLEGTQAKVQAEIAKSAIDGETARISGQQKAAALQMDSAAKIAELRMKLAAAEQEHYHKTVEAQFAHGQAMDKMALERQKQAAAATPKWPQDQPGF